MVESNSPSNFFSATLCSSNILLDEHKVTKVGDFGLAKGFAWKELHYMCCTWRLTGLPGSRDSGRGDQPEVRCIQSWCGEKAVFIVV